MSLIYSHLAVLDRQMAIELTTYEFNQKICQKINGRIKLSSAAIQMQLGKLSRTESFLYFFRGINGINPEAAAKLRPLLAKQKMLVDLETKHNNISLQALKTLNMDKYTAGRIIHNSMLDWLRKTGPAARQAAATRAKEASSDQKDGENQAQKIQALEAEVRSLKAELAALKASGHKGR